MPVNYPHDRDTVPGYGIWYRATSKLWPWRWSRCMDYWPDNGKPGQAHGGCESKDEATAAAREHKKKPPANLL